MRSIKIATPQWTQASQVWATGINPERLMFRRNRPEKLGNYSPIAYYAGRRTDV